MESSFLESFRSSIVSNWDNPALTDYKSTTFTYKDIGRKIAKLHILLEQCGVKKGDKVALIGKNSSNWAVVYIATLSYGAVLVPILHEFKPDGIHHIVNHSEAKILFIGEAVWENVDPAQMLHLSAIFSLRDLSLLYSRDPNAKYAREHLNKLFGEKYPNVFGKESLVFHKENPDDLALISYTSGTTSQSKGVMLPYRSLYSNLMFADGVIDMKAGDNIVVMLPMAHMYGMAFEFIYEFCAGAHLHFLTKTPSPKVIFDAFAEIKPDLIVSVPLVIEKIFRKQIQPIIDKTMIKTILSIPVLDSVVTDKIQKQLSDAFGGRFFEVIIGGAAFNREADLFFNRINFRYTVGYGMTECGPIITYADWKEFKPFSCGKITPRMEIRIDSEDPLKIAGEILVRGDNVMLGYYKNPEATKAVFTEDGWFRTGDLGMMDKDGFLYIKGRCKTMILGPSGQNIYPEEIEDSINTMEYVAESLVLDMGESRLEALVYPDMDATDRSGLSYSQIEEIMEKHRNELNKSLPAYSQIARIRITTEEFEKTPKRSIKRFLYQMNKT
ncbi:MAG: AMP-binding protein [Bacteroidales bacterium]|jgi:long-chain acyl-CoA synthetase|nr:AMP-binding protein [Bacteroidales bacterium]